ncbi:MAG TPA: MFS transporter [Phenylobacterium sp.]|nr:MFS transporter [Phenylobacterium sp.]
MSPSKIDGPLPLRTKFAFGVGSAAETLALLSVSSFAMLYYNQVLGLRADLAGLAISASLILDGFADPIVGALSDRTRSRFGRRHGYMFAAPLFIGAALIGVFNPAAGLGQLGLFLWFTGSVALLRICMSVYHTPHLALGGELSTDYTERSKIMSWNNFFAWAGGALTSFFALRFVFKATPEYPRGLLNPAPYSPFSIACAILAVTILFASAWFTRDQIARLPKPPAHLPKLSPFEFLKDLGQAMSNRNYLWLLIGYFFLSMMIGLRTGLHLYVNTYFWQLKSEEIALFVIGSFAGYASGFLFSARLHGRFDKRRTIIASTLTYAVAPAVPITLGQMGLLSHDTPGLLAMLIGFSVISYGAVSIAAITILSALADVADQNELKYGVRQEGVLYSTRALAAKVDQAIGAALAGFALTIINFPAKAHPGQVPHEVVWNLALFDGVLATIPGVIAAFFYARYGITRRSYEETRLALLARRDAASGATRAPAATSVEDRLPEGAAPTSGKA